MLYLALLKPRVARAGTAKRAKHAVSQAVVPPKKRIFVGRRVIAGEPQLKRERIVVTASRFAHAPNNNRYMQKSWHKPETTLSRLFIVIAA